MLVRRFKDFANVCIENLIFLIGLLLVGFILPRLIPGSPILYESDSMNVLNASLSEESFNAFKAYYSPEMPILVQFGHYLLQLSNLDFGISFSFGLPVIDLIQGRVGWTLLITTVSILLSAALAIPIGIYAGLKKGKGFDVFLTMAFILLESMPIFLVALFLQFWLGYALHIFPTQGAYALGATPESVGFKWDVLNHAMMPILAVAFSLIPSMVILTRNVVARVHNEPYIQLAYYNHINKIVIVFRYILKNAFPEILGKLNIHFIYAIAGVMFVEMIFSYPGMGMLLKDSISARDYTLIQGIFLTVGIYGIIVNTLFGWVNSLLFPRMKI